MNMAIELILKIMLAFSADFNIPVNNIDIKVLPAEKIDLVVNDPHRGMRKADAYISKNGIVFNYDHWKAINSWQQKELVYHELGHLLFGMHHPTEPNRIMNPFAGKKMYWVEPNGSNWRMLVNKMKQNVGRR